MISYPVAYYIAVVAPARRRNLLLGLVVVPFWTSFLIRTYAWMFILRTEGLVNRLLLGIGPDRRSRSSCCTTTSRC